MCPNSLLPMSPVYTQGCVYGVARRQAGQARAVAINLIGTLQNFGSTPVSMRKLRFDPSFPGFGCNWPSHEVYGTAMALAWILVRHAKRA